MSLSWALLLLVSISTSVAEVLACSCLPPPEASEAMSRADAVFLGQVSSVRSSDYGIEAVFAVAESWKGIHSETVQVRTSGATCGHSFEVGQWYLLYASKSKRDDSPLLESSICSRHELLSGSGRTPPTPRDAEVLGTGTRWNIGSDQK